MPELDSRPIYEPPEILRLDEIQQGFGLCQAGSQAAPELCNNGGVAAGGSGGDCALTGSSYLGCQNGTVPSV